MLFRSQPYGIKNSIYTVSSDGTDGTSGQGVGGNGGQGDGKGPGIGPGSDGGKGGGKEGGIGPDSGRGIATREANEIETELPPPAKKVTIAMKVLFKPKATYTDDARQNAIQGTVTLRVTFLANGSIGAITVVGGLPNGLTEQAIAAARSMKFEPQKINGVAQTVTRQVQYTFTLF